MSQLWYQTSYKISNFSNMANLTHRALVTYTQRYTYTREVGNHWFREWLTKHKETIWVNESMHLSNIVSKLKVF